MYFKKCMSSITLSLPIWPNLHLSPFFPIMIICLLFPSLSLENFITGNCHHRRTPHLTILSPTPPFTEEVVVYDPLDSSWISATNIDPPLVPSHIIHPTLDLIFLSFQRMVHEFSGDFTISSAIDRYRKTIDFNLYGWKLLQVLISSTVVIGN